MQMPTTVNQDARDGFIALYVCRVTGAKPRSPQTQLRSRVGEIDAQLAAARFRRLSSEVRGCAILGHDGELLAATGERTEWDEPARALLTAADGAAQAPAAHAHVATEEGEVYAARWGNLAMVAVTDRFTLASLVLSDMRATLRELALDEPCVAEAA